MVKITKSKTFSFIISLATLLLLSGCNNGSQPGLPPAAVDSIAQGKILSGVAFDQLGQIPSAEESHGYFIRLFNYENVDYRLKQINLLNADGSKLSNLEASVDSSLCHKLPHSGSCELKLTGKFTKSISFFIVAALSESDGNDYEVRQMVRVVEHPTSSWLNLPGYGAAAATAESGQLNLSLPFILQEDVINLDGGDKAKISCEHNNYKHGDSCSYQLSMGQLQVNQAVNSTIKAQSGGGERVAEISTRAVIAVQANLLLSQAAYLDLRQSTNNESTTTVIVYNNGLDTAQDMQLQLPLDQKLKQLYPGGACASRLVPGASCSYTLVTQNIESSEIKNIGLNYKPKSSASAETITFPVVILAQAPRVELLMIPNRPFKSAAIKADNPLMVTILNSGNQLMTNLNLYSESSLLIESYLPGSQEQNSLCKFNDGNYRLNSGQSCYFYVRLSPRINLPLTESTISSGAILLSSDTPNNYASYLKYESVNIAQPNRKNLIWIARGVEGGSVGLYESGFSGNFGGLAGADEACRKDVQAYPYLYTSVASKRIKAVMDGNNSFLNRQALTYYNTSYLQKALGNPTTSEVFQNTNFGYGPLFYLNGEALFYSSTTYKNSSVWTGFQRYNCNNWTSNSDSFSGGVSSLVPRTGNPSNGLWFVYYNGDIFNTQRKCNGSSVTGGFLQPSHLVCSLSEY